MNPWILVLVLLIALVLLAGAHLRLRRGYWALFRSRRDVSQRDCEKSLRRLGFRSIQEYEGSELWQLTKRRYRKSDYPQRCLVCGAAKVDLHHRSYARLGVELFDLVPLCRRHHDDLHQLIDCRRNICVNDTHDFLTLLRENAPEREIEVTGTGEHVYGFADAGKPGGNLDVRQINKRKRRRAGRKWSAEEDAILLEGYDQGAQVEQLAERLHRGVRAVEVRLFKLGRVTPGITAQCARSAAK